LTFLIKYDIIKILKGEIKMTWFDKIRLGMALMKEGCVDNQSSEKCDKECPFRNLCSYFVNQPQPLPEDWETEDG
jgi:hypothetical protein